MNFEYIYLYFVSYPPVPAPLHTSIPFHSSPQTPKKKKVKFTNSKNLFAFSIRQPQTVRTRPQIKICYTEKFLWMHRKLQWSFLIHVIYYKYG